MSLAHPMPLFKAFSPAALGVVLLVSCGGGKIPQTRYYALDLPPAPIPAAAPADAPALAVMPVVAADMLAQDRIVYRPAREEVGFYEYHRWAENPRTTVRNAIVARLRETGAFRSVAPYDGRTSADYLLRTRLERLEEVDFDNGVKVHAAIAVELVEAKTAQVVWTGRGTGEGTVSQADVREVVTQLSAATRRSLDQIAEGLTGYIRSRR